MSVLVFGFLVLDLAIQSGHGGLRKELALALVHLC